MHTNNIFYGLASPSPTYGASGLPQALYSLKNDIPFFKKLSFGQNLTIVVNILSMLCIFGTVLKCLVVVIYLVYFGIVVV